MVVTDLKCNHRKNPIGIEEKPYFSWKLESGRQGVIQTAYRIEVYNDKKCVWDSGKTVSDQSTFVPFEGDSLESGVRYFWTVTVWDNAGNASSAEAFFETALLHQTEWKAKWVECRQRHKKKTPAVLFRKDFRVRKKLSSARVYATCHGIYRLSINGERADDRELAPEHTAYEKCLYYQTYDITSLLKQGENTIGMHVGDGWYFSMMSRKNGKNFSNHFGVLFQIELVYEDGTRETIISDEDVKYNVGAVQYSDLYYGEIYDARKLIPDWDTPECREEGWKDAKIGKFSLDNLKSQKMEPVREYRKLPVQEVITTPKGEKVLDFGQNFAGRVRMKVQLPKDAQIQLEHSETLGADGNYFNNIQGINQKDLFISDGKETVYEPLFTFHGFRYVRITGEEQIRPEDFIGIALTSEKEDLGTFACSDAEINRLVSNALWSQKSNLLSIPTDCPQREKAGWTGDIGVYGKTAMANEDITAFLTSWLENLKIEQKEDGQIPPVVPFSDFYGMTSKLQPLLMGGSLKDISSSGWADCCIDLPYDMYCLTGNTDILSRQYPVMKKWLSYVEKQAGAKRNKDSGVEKDLERYLWNTGFHYGEWLIPSCCEENGSMSRENFASAKEGKHYVAPVYFYTSTKKMAEIAKVLGKAADAEYYEKLSEKILKACQKSLLTDDNRMRYERQGAYVLALQAGIIPKEKRQLYADRLAELIRENEYKLDTGFLGTPYLLDALSRNGYGEMAWTVLKQPECPGWMYEIRKGATTIWESWNCYEKDGTIQLMSMNHYAFGCVCDWIYRNISGIDYLEPGYKKIKIAPKPYGNLTWARRSFRCEYGEIESAWKRENGVFTLEVKIPCNTSAVIELPDGRTESVGSGSYQFTSEGEGA